MATVTPPAPQPSTQPRPAAAGRPAAPARPRRPAAPHACSARRATPDAATRARIDQLLARIEDAYFDYDKHTLRADAIEALRKDSTELRDILKDYPDYKLTIEGHADERGSAEYNMALGQARAEAAKDYLVRSESRAAARPRQLRQRKAGLPGTDRRLLAEESPHPHRRQRDHEIAGRIGGRPAASGVSRRLLVSVAARRELVCGRVRLRP